MTKQEWLVTSLWIARIYSRAVIKNNIQCLVFQKILVPKCWEKSRSTSWYWEWETWDPERWSDLFKSPVAGPGLLNCSHPSPGCRGRYHFLTGDPNPNRRVHHRWAGRWHVVHLLTSRSPVCITFTLVQRIFNSWLNILIGTNFWASCQIVIF